MHGCLTRRSGQAPSPVAVIVVPFSTATKDVITITTPVFSCDTQVAPFVTLEWAADGLGPAAQPTIDWRLEAEKEWAADQQATFPRLSKDDGLRYVNVPLHLMAGYQVHLAQVRLRFNHAFGSRITLKSLITAIDTRHPITGGLFVRGSSELFFWTRDVEFLKASIGRMRQAIDDSLTEFAVEEQAHVVVPWVGHDGRSGLVPDGKGSTMQRFGFGVGNNYWDLLPFGGYDALATITRRFSTVVAGRKRCRPTSPPAALLITKLAACSMGSNNRGMPMTRWEHPAMTTHGRGNHAVRTEQWRYIRYANGEEELYDHRIDRLEQTNVALKTEHTALKRQLASLLPADEAEELPSRKSGGRRRGRQTAEGE